MCVYNIYIISWKQLTVLDFCGSNKKIMAMKGDRIIQAPKTRTYSPEYDENLFETMSHVCNDISTFLTHNTLSHLDGTIWAMTYDYDYFWT